MRHPPLAPSLRAAPGLSLCIVLLCACTPQEALPGPDQDPDAGALRDAGAPGGDSGIGYVDPQQDTRVPYDAGPGWSYGTCGALYGCVQAACKGAAAGCDQPCIDKASAKAIAQYADYGKCLSQACVAGACKGSHDPGCVAQCTAKRCVGVLLECLAGSRVGGNGCASMYAADQACSKASNLYKCLTDSFGTLSGPAQEAYVAMQMCLATSSGPDPWGACLPQVMTCSSNGKVGPAPCREVLDCETVCATAHHLYACLGGCYAKGTAPAQAHYLELKSCLRAAESGKAGDGACFATAAACAEPAGSSSCAEVWDCTNTCKADTGKQEPYCALACLHDAAPAAAADFSAWWGCREAACRPKCGSGKACLQSCFASICGALRATCFGS